MFRNKTTCTSCSEKIDALDVDCPYCHTHNIEYDKIHLSKNALNNKWYFQLIFFGVGWLGLQIIATATEILALFITKVPLEELTKRVDIVGPIEFITYFILLAAMVLLLFLSKSYKSFPRIFKDWKTYVFGLAGLGMIYVASYIWELISQGFVNETSSNQSLVRDITIAYPALSIIFFCFVGPLCEELTYRVGLFGLMRRVNRVAAYFVAIFFFAFVHFDISSILVIFTKQDVSFFIKELWNFPSYLIGAAVLVFVYDFWGFGASSFTHVLNNLIGILLILFKYYAGI